MLKFKYNITDKLGIHARPAGEIGKTAKEYKSNITLKAAGKEAGATRIMAVMGLGVKCGDEIQVIIEGEDEEAAYKGMMELFKNIL